MENILSENDKVSDEISAFLRQKGVLAINVLGAPGIGKTTVITNIINGLGDLKGYVIEGDIESDIDTVKLKELGIETIQINTNGACHLDAMVIKENLANISFDKKGILFIENIGNLVCPAEFFIGEQCKLLITSVTDGSDKPYKYPLAFEKADAIIINKTDLLPYVDFDEDFFVKGVKALNNNAPIFKLSNKDKSKYIEVIEWIKKKHLQF
jgi:hydrogenase nickel incorporation protein HypB